MKAWFSPHSSALACHRSLHKYCLIMIIMTIWRTFFTTPPPRANYQSDRWDGSVPRRKEGVAMVTKPKSRTVREWSCDQYLAKLLQRSGPAHRRTLNLNRWQQSQAHPAEFICYSCLWVRLAACLVQLLPKTRDTRNLSPPNDRPAALSTAVRKAWVELLEKY